MFFYPFPYRHGRVVYKTNLKKARFNEDYLIVKTMHGFKIKIPPNDFIGKQIYFTRQFDKTIPEVLKYFSKQKDTILDIGANIGYVSCYLLKKYLNQKSYL